MIGCIGLFTYGIVQQIVFHHPWGNKPMSDQDLILYAGLSIVICIVVLVLFATARLTTEVRDDGLYLRFFPFHLRFYRIPLENVIDCHALTYHPIRQYGGWGIRFRLGGKAYNVKGNRGVRLDYNNRRHLLIGSQRADELAARIDHLLETAQ